jgi:hypothetical protein
MSSEWLYEMNALYFLMDVPGSSEAPRATIGLHGTTDQRSRVVSRTDPALRAID